MGGLNDRHESEDDMNMTQEIWTGLTPAEKDEVRDLGGLSNQLIGLEGCRVEVLDKHYKTRRFQVGRSTGWVPCHIELHRSDSSGGGPADQEYKTVRVIRGRR